IDSGTKDGGATFPDFLFANVQRRSHDDVSHSRISLRTTDISITMLSSGSTWSPRIVMKSEYTHSIIEETAQRCTKIGNSFAKIWLNQATPTVNNALKWLGMPCCQRNG